MNEAQKYLIENGISDIVINIDLFPDNTPENADNWVYLSASLQGKYVGAMERGNGIWRVFYRNVFLGYFNENELRIKDKSVRLETNLV